MSSPGIEPRNSNRNGFLFYNFQLDLSEKSKTGRRCNKSSKKPSFFKTYVERSSKNSK